MILVLSSVLAICAVTLEIGVKIFKPQPVYSRLSLLAGSFYINSDTTDWTLKPSHIAEMPSMESPGLIVSASINSQGLRGPEIIENIPKTVVLGDSYTFGVYVADNQTYVHQINMLSEQNNDNMLYLNAGYTGGLETDQHYAWLKQNLLNIKPKKLIYATFPPNDIMGISPESWTKVDENGLPVKWDNSDFVVNEFGSIEYTGVSRTYLSFLHSIPILRESHLLVATVRVIDMLVSEPTDHSEGYQFLYGLEQSEFAEQEIRYLNLIAGMQDLAEMNSIDFSVVLLPINFQIEPEKKDLFFSGMDRFDGLIPIYYDKLEHSLKMLGIEVLNIEKAMKSSNSGPFFPANGEPHFNSNGHLFVAKALYKYLKSK
ncbi:hypothetical protein OAH94_02310 [Amylibacter sp.]|nr:hypothetical protein [Amylibacter sp.]